LTSYHDVIVTSLPHTLWRDRSNSVANGSPFLYRERRNRQQAQLLAMLPEMQKPLYLAAITRGVEGSWPQACVIGLYVETIPKYCTSPWPLRQAFDQNETERLTCAKRSVP